jgi:uroporphyrinogen-III decarboxylase
MEFADEWMELENIILSDVSQDQKVKNHMFSLICGISTNTNTANVMENRSA